MEAELIVEMYRDLDLDEQDLSMNLECLELGSLNYEHVKTPISNMDYENNYMGNETESHKNRDKKGYKEQIVKIKPR